eukprot:Ihof_evm4s89 gene=Ihof_evmTU4s89
MNNTNVASNFSDLARPLFSYDDSDPINAGYCLQADVPRKGRYLYDCEHPLSNLVMKYNGKDEVSLTGDVVRCNVRWSALVCSKLTSRNTCKFDFKYPVRPDPESNRLLSDVQGKSGGGTVTCGREIINYIGNPEERFLTMAKEAFEQGVHGYGWIYQPNSIDADVSDRRGNWEFSLICAPDVDECTANTHSCDANAECLNTQGSFTCSCKEGYASIGEECKQNKHVVVGTVLNDVNCDMRPDGDNGIANITVNAYRTDDPSKVFASVKTDENGNFKFDLEPGSYQIKVNLPKDKVLSYYPTKSIGGVYPLEVGKDKSENIIFGIRDNVETIMGRVQDDYNRDNNPKDDPGVSGITLRLFNKEGKVVGSTITDGKGFFKLMAHKGEYTLKVTLPSGKVIAYDPSGRLDGTEKLTVVPNVSINNIIFGIRDAPQSLTGSVKNDANRDRLPNGDTGFPNVIVNLINEDGQIIANTSTDAKGDYKFEVVPGKYKIEIVPPNGKVISYAPATATGNSVSVVIEPNTDISGIMFGLRDATQMISGKVLEDANRDGKPDGDKGLPEITIRLIKPDGQVIATATTDTNGNFGMEASPGKYTVEISIPSGKSIAYDISGTRDGVTPITVLSNQNIQNIIYGIRDNTQSITGKINYDTNNDGKPNGDPGYADVVINIIDSNGKIIATQPTDKQGNFKIDVIPGTYTIAVVLPNGKVISYAPDGASSNTTPINVVPGTDYDGVVFGLRDKTQMISGRVQNDANRDGNPNDDAGVPAIPVTLLDLENNVIARITTDANGNFKFNATPGPYTVKIGIPTGKTIAYDISGNRDGSALINVQPNIDYTGVIFGIQDITKIINGEVLYDANRDSKSNGDKGFEDVTVSLVNDKGVVIDTTETNYNGAFQFKTVPGKYTIRVTEPTGKIISYAPSGAIKNSILIDLLPNPNPYGSNLIFGLRDNTQIISGTVHSDDNRDGKPDNDPGLAGITVKLYDDSGTVVAQTTTAADGSYKMDAPPGSYTVRVDSPLGKEFSYGPNGSKNNGVSIVVKPNENIIKLDFGFKDISEGVVTGKVLDDENFDGRSQGDTKPIVGALVIIRDIEGNEISRTTTNGRGMFRFEKLPPDEYTVKITPPASYNISYDSDGVPNGSVKVKVNNLIAQSVLFGLASNLGDIKGVVLRDRNRDGFQTGDLAYPKNLTIRLIDSKGIETNKTTSDSEGKFEFLNIPSGIYKIKVDVPDEVVVNYQTGKNKDGVVDVTVSPAYTAPVVFGLMDKTSLIGGIVFHEEWDADYNRIRVPNPNIIVRLIDEKGNVVNTTRTNAKGQYLFNKVSPGTHTVMIETPANYVVFFDPDNTNDGTHKVVVTLGQNQQVNFGIEPATGSIKGHVVDDIDLNKEYGNGDKDVPNVQVQLLDTAGKVISVTTTDDKGKFVFPDMPVQKYRVKILVPTDKAISFNPDSTNHNEISLTLEYGGKDNLIFGLRPSGADVRGIIRLDRNRDGKNNGDPGMPGTTLQLIDPKTNEVISTTVTQPDGSYIFPDVPPGTYTLKVITPPGQEIAYQPPDSENGELPISVLPNKSVYSEFGYRPIGQIVSGRVNRDTNYDGRPDNDPAAVNIQVELISLKTGQIVKTTSTDSNGQYMFPDVVAGEYSIRVIPPTNNAIAYQPLNAKNGNAPIRVIGGESIMGITFGIRPDGAYISGKITKDTDRNSLPEDDPGLGGVTVQLLGPSGAVVSTVQTKPDGTYLFPFVPTGEYRVKVVPPSGTQIAYQPNGAINGILPVKIVPGQPVNASFGIKDLGTSVCGAVNRDINIDGTSSGDMGILGVTVQLINPDTGKIIKSNSTLESGKYCFNDIPAGKYNVKVVLPTGSTISYQPNKGTNGITPVSVTTGTPVNDVIFGLKPIGASISGQVNIDSNRDKKSPNDSPVKDVTVLLLDSNGEVIANTTTDLHGRYVFPLVPVGDYVVKVVPPKNSELSYEPEGSKNGEYPVNIEANKPQTAIFGIKPVGTCLSGKVKRDEDFNKSPIDDPGIAGVTVRLINSITNKATTITYTEYDGSYKFCDIPAGKYSIVVVPLKRMTFSYQPNGSIDGKWPVTVSPNVPIKDIVFGLSPGVQDITGEVLFDDNQDEQPDFDEGAFNIAVILQDKEGKPLIETTTDIGGNYVFPDVPAGEYKVVVVSPEQSDFSYQPENSVNGVLPITNVPGIPVHSIFGLLPLADAQILGMVWLDADPLGNPDGDTKGVAGVDIILEYDFTEIGETVTDSKGNYQFDNLIPGEYTVIMVPPEGYEHSYDPSGTNSGTAFVTTDIDEPGEAVFGIKPATQDINGLVLNDVNSDNTPNGDKPIVDIVVRLLDSKGTLITTTKSGSDGDFIFSNILNGQYTIRVDIPVDMEAVYEIDEHVDGSVSVTLNEFSDPSPVIFGLRPIQYSSALCVVVSDDKNSKKVTETSQPIEDISCSIYSLDDISPNATAATNKTGMVTFPKLTTGEYHVQIVVPEGMTNTFDNDDTTDARTIITVTPDDVAIATFGLRRPANSVIIVNVQLDKSGMPSPTNPVLANVQVTLQDDSGTTIGTKLTSATGKVEFTKLVAGMYSVSIRPIEGTTFGFDPDDVTDGLTQLMIDVSDRAMFTFGLKKTGTVCGRQLCHLRAACVDQSGAYGGSKGKACKCNDGWKGDGEACTDDDECAGLGLCHLANSACSNTIGSYTCSCKDGFSLKHGACLPATCTGGGYGGRICSASSSKMYEYNAMTVTSVWRKVSFKSAFDIIPVVFSGPASFGNSDPADVVIRKVTNVDFEIKLLEPVCFDGQHPRELVAWFAVRPDQHFTFGGQNMKAARAQAVVGQKFYMRYPTVRRIPALFGQVQNLQDGEIIAVRPTRISRTQVEMTIQGGPDAINRQQVIIGVLMVVANSGAVNKEGGPAVRFAAGTVSGVGSDFTTIGFPDPNFFLSNKPPVLIASVLLAKDGPGGSSRMLGFTVPNHSIFWVELLLIQVITPNVSFLGHLCGILAGLTISS